MTATALDTDVLVIGASAAGLMCAIEAGKRGRKVVVLDHASKPGKKILMSGGGRCNFTNLNIGAENFISHNPHFCKSSLSRFSQWDFIAMVEAHGIKYHERAHGQLFCDESAKDILQMLLSECAQVGVSIRLNCQITDVDERFSVRTSMGLIRASSLVVASGGLSIPKMCATSLGYDLAKKFGHHVWPTRAGLVPFTLQPADKAQLSALSGIAVDSSITNEGTQFRENLLFTHRGLSGPAILQMSSYWLPGEAIVVDLMPDSNLDTALQTRRSSQPNIKLRTALAEHFPKRLLISFIDQNRLDKPLQALSNADFLEVAANLQRWTIKPNGTEGYRTAEVTLGGIDCNELSSRTMESNKVPGLYFVGEVVDVTGWLGGYNFQWAWSSGWSAGNAA